MYSRKPSLLVAMYYVPQFGTAYQSDNSFVRLTCLIEHESKGCVSLSYLHTHQKVFDCLPILALYRPILRA